MAAIRPKIGLHDFRDHLSCPNCNQVYDKPQLLPCLDSVCERCLNAHPVEEVEQQDEQQGPEIPHENFHCPRECCEKQFSTNAQARDVIDNTFLANLVETFNLDHKLREGKRLDCDECGERESAVVVCLHEPCRKLLCQQCCVQHQRSRESRDHLLLEVGRLCNSGATHQQEAQAITRKAWYCDMHKKQQICMYCDQHEEVMCLMCRNDYHGECRNVKTVEMLFRDEDPLTQMRETIQQVEQMNNELQHAIETVNTIKDRLGQNETQAIESIDNRYKWVVRQLAVQRDRLKEKVAGMRQVKADLLDRQLEVFKRVHRNVDHSLKFINDSVDIATDVEFYFLKCPFERRMDELKSILNGVHKDPLENDFIEHNPGPQDENIHLCDALGSVHSTPTVANFTVENNGRRQIEFETGSNSSVTVVCKDAGGNIVRGQDIRSMPPLQARLVSGGDNINPEEVQHAVIGTVKVSTVTGKYLVQVTPQERGAHQLYVYLKRPDPYGIELINEGQLINVMVTENMMSRLSLLPFKTV